MQISKDSWHYRVILWHKDRESRVPENICPYMRVLVAAIFKGILLGAIIVLLASLVASMVLSPLLWLANHYYAFLPDSWLVSNDKSMSTFMLFTLLGTVCYVICGGLLTVFGIKAGATAGARIARQHFNLTPIAEKPPGLIRTYLKGWHDKTCVGLDFVDAAEDNA